MRDYTKMTPRDFTDARTEFQKMCYELYKIKWESLNAPAVLKREKYLQFMEDQLSSKTDCSSFSIYLLENGYIDNDCYSNYPDFVCFMYTDKAYMRGLLGGDGALFAEYEEIVAEDARRRKAGIPGYDTPRTRQDTIEYFRKLAAESATLSIKNRDDVSRGRAEAYENAALEMAMNMLPEARC